MQRSYQWINGVQINNMCRSLYTKILDYEHFVPDVIVSVLDGGYVAGMKLGRLFDVPVVQYKVSKYDVKGELLRPNGIAETEEDLVPIKKYKNILIVDDVCETGDTLEIMKALCADENKTVKTAVLLMAEGVPRERQPTFYANIKPVSNWVLFPWESKQL